MTTNLVASGPCPLFTVDREVQYIDVTRLHVKSLAIRRDGETSSMESCQPDEIFEPFDRLEILDESPLQTSVREWWQDETTELRFSRIFVAVFWILAATILVLGMVMVGIIVDYILSH